jgi:hypothetical protein
MKRQVLLGALFVLGLAGRARADAGAFDPPLELGDPSGSELAPSELGPRDEPSSPRATERRRPGTHFIGELRLGSTLDGPGEFGYGGVLGVGGRWYGLPPMYWIGSVDHTSAGRAVRGSDGFGYDEHLSLTSVGTGLRVYVPIAGPFRIMADITVGAIATRASFDDGSQHVVEDLWLPYTELGIGPQFRVLHHLSLGARASVAFVDTSALDRSGPASAWEGELDQRSSVMGTVTLHF